MSFECFMVERSQEVVVEATEHGTRSRHLWHRLDSESLGFLQDLPPGAMYYATWLEELGWHWKGPDGRVLCVVLPDGHHWTIDSRASNCSSVDMPEDDGHRCWVRHGSPPLVTVDKNGLTCSAGAGSVLSPRGWHGFLRAGVLVA